MAFLPRASCVSAALLALAVGAERAAAQAPAPATALPATPRGASDTNTQLYDQGFFAQYNLTNAEDMLRRLPGVSPILDGAGGTNQARGLGSGGDQILIGGKRLAAKGQILQTLRRIPAANVQRVELIRGTSGEIEVLSEGLLVNVVLKEGVNVGGAGAYELNYRFDDLSWSDVDGLISYANSWGRLSYTLAYEKNLWTPLGQTPTGGAQDYTRRWRDELYYSPAGVVTEVRPQRWKREHHKQIFTANLTYEFQSEGQARLNILYQPHPTKETDVTKLSRPALLGVPAGRAEELHIRRTRRDLLDIGGEVEKRIGLGRARLIFIHTRLALPVHDFRNRYEAAGPVEISRSDSLQNTGEDILRGSYSWTLFKGQEVTLGVEGARNTLAQDLQVYFDVNRDGRLDTIAIPTAHAEVAEARGEVFANHNWKITPKLTLESSLNVELSRITTNYPFIPVRTYVFPKPRFDLRYNITPRDRLRLKVERLISQLDFGAFVPTYNVVDVRIDAGNPSLAPEDAWQYEAGIEHRLAGDNGTMEARAFYRDISGHIDRIPFGVNAAGLPFSAPGNIDKARLYGLELKAGVRLTALGARNAQVNVRYLVQSSSVVDPFTGHARKMKDPYASELTLGFRHDVTSRRASYGATLYGTTGHQLVSDIRNLEFFSRGPRLDAFVEKALWGSATLRLEVYNLTRSHEYKQRILYTVSQAAAGLQRTESYEEFRDRRFAIRLRGKF